MIQKECKRPKNTNERAKTDLGMLKSDGGVRRSRERVLVLDMMGLQRTRRSKRLRDKKGKTKKAGDCRGRMRKR